MLFIVLMLVAGGQSARATLDRAIEDFRAGRVERSVVEFDRVAAMSPAQFFARLYTGLYLEATGDAAAGRVQIEIAAEDRFAGVGGYMHDVAKVHLQRK